MGAYSPAPILTKEMEQKIMDEVRPSASSLLLSSLELSDTKVCEP